MMIHPSSIACFDELPDVDDSDQTIEFSGG
jgi:hypothetical protein